MMFCEQCGSTSRDSQGFCRGCGAPIPGQAGSAVGEPVAASQLENATQISSLRLPSDLPAIGEKNVWIAALLAALFGPVGMFYSTALGGFVMIVVATLLRIFVGGPLVWLAWPVCIFWAVMAARS